MNLDRRRAEWIGAGVLTLILILFAAALIDRQLDRSYITYRYAHNLSSGYGLVYNIEPEPMLSGAVSLVYVVILSLFHSFFSNLPLVSHILGIVSIGLCGLFIYFMARSADLPEAFGAAAFTLVFPLLWATLGLETSTWMALCTGGVWLYLSKRDLSAVVVLVFATLMRAETLALILVLAADVLASRRAIKIPHLIAYAAGIGFPYLMLVGAFGRGRMLPVYPSPELAAVLPEAVGTDVLSGLASFSTSLINLSWFWGIIFLICLAGITQLRGKRWAIILVAWAGLHIAILLVFRVGTYLWAYAPLAIGMAALFGSGLTLPIEALKKFPARAIHIGLAGLLLLGAAGQSAWNMLQTPAGTRWHAFDLFPPDNAYRLAGEWFKNNTPENVLVATTQPGLLGYVSRRNILDYHGALQADVADAFSRSDGQWWLAHYQPDYVVLHSSEASSLDGYALTSDEWFVASYLQVVTFDVEDPADPLLIYQRTGAARQFTRTLIGYMNYPEGLTVNGIGSDFSLAPLESGRFGLLQIEWLVTQTISGSRYVSIQIQGRDTGAVAGLAGRTVDFSRWSHRKLVTTYHPIQIAPGMPPGVYDIQVGVGSDALNQTVKVVGVAKIPFEGGSDLGGISGTRADFGNVALVGYRMGLTSTGLNVFLLWEAVHNPQTDYQVSIQVRDLNGMVVLQYDSQPRQGKYPTSVWSPGEQVSDIYLLDVSQIPPGDYEVYVGLLASDGSRLVSTDRKDAIFVGRLSLTP